MPITHQTESHANHPTWIRRELDWILTAQPLVSLGQGPLVAPLGRLLQVDTEAIAHDIADLWAWNGPPRRLGRRFEQLLMALFEGSPAVRVLGHGIAIQAGEQTRGELDFLIALGSDVVHLEVALKFYAGVGTHASRRSPRHWIGPSTQDRLDRKIEHLTQHQLPLSAESETHQQLADRGIPAPNHRQAWIFGRLLHPAPAPLEDRVGPEGLADSFGNYWCTYQQRDAAFRQLARPVGSHYGWSVITHDALIGQHCGPAQLPMLPTDQLAPPDHSLILVLVPKTESNGEERTRLWILPDDFPERAHNSL